MSTAIEFDPDGNLIGTNSGNQEKRLFLAVEHTGTLWSTHEFQNETLRGLRFGGGIQGIGKRQGDPGNTYLLPAFVIGNLMASYQVKVMHKMRLTAQLNVMCIRRTIFRRNQWWTFHCSWRATYLSRFVTDRLLAMFSEVDNMNN